MSDKLEIKELFAFVADEEQGEGIVGMQFGRTFMPFVGADMERVESLRFYAKQIAEKTGKRVRLIKFTERTELGDA